MEVATTNNHNQSHLHHMAHHMPHHYEQQHQQQQHNNSLSHHQHATNAAAAPPRSPFQREVREWQRIDPDTGALLSGRLEADRWVNGPTHSYGKISDSQNISQPNGTQHSQRKQLEVLQARTANGAMQVIRAQTVQTTSSRWSSTSASASASASSTSSPIMMTNGGAGVRSLLPPQKPLVAETSTRWLQMPATVDICKKSNSSLSSNNSSSTNSTTMSNNTYKSGGKVSLHAIVGNNANNETKSPTLLQTSNTIASTSSTHWSTAQRNSSRHYEQPTLYGNGNIASKSHVGGAAACDCTQVGDDAAVGAVDDVRRSHSFNHHHHQRLTHQPIPNDDLTPTHLGGRHQRRDLESFRHYGNTAGNHVDDDDDDDLRLNPRHQRRQQSHPLSGLTRSRSISTDDLSTDSHSEEPSEWRRVSKLRRSFQNSSSNGSESYSATPPSTRRPLDLPSNSVSVSRIRAELENGRRLNTAMRNNHVDLAALDNILNSPKESRAITSKRSSFLTAESLKEIRGKLKKLSDESLYKDDFIAYQQPPAIEEHIEVQHVRRKSPEQPLNAPSAFKSVSKDSYTTQRSLPADHPHSHTTHSLESRQKYKDTSSTEWHLRRKSYGFEKMSPPDSKSMFRMDASTDSGLGRSGELNNWSPTGEQSSTPSTRSTMVHFGERKPTRPRQHTLSSPTASADDDELSKRHSIAVDESQYMRKATQVVHLNGFYDTKTSTNTNDSQSSSLFQRSQQKRVEFCKTEVHFAAESGRVNIVETDGKPPPTNNFRRRRRTSSGPLQSLVKSAAPEGTTPVSGVSVPITHFGDDPRRKIVTASTMVACKATLVEVANDGDGVDDVLEGTNVTVSLPAVRDSYVESARSSYASTTSGVETTTDNEADEISAIRGILKNKPVKPKPYHLGENIESADALWGVQLKPISSGSGSLAVKRDEGGDSPPSIKSVAERVRIVEKRQDHTTNVQSNGYSTKINLSLDDSQRNWPENGSPTSASSTRRPSAQELLLQDLREHQRILDEGLKSTSLIIKTMRSANEFDEAMRRLSIASLEAAVIPPIVVPTPMIRSNSYQESSTRRCSITSQTEESSITSTHTHSFSGTSDTRSNVTATVRRLSSDMYSSFVAPIAAPRLKLLGNTEIPVSQQLSQLRRMYEVACTSQDDDSADEEVKRYFAPHNETTSDSGGGTQDSSSMEEDHGIEYSSSWSRLKAKRTIWQIQAEQSQQDKRIERTDLPKSNVMNIELHSPLSLNEGRGSLKRNKTPPVAKPRTTANVSSHDHSPIRSGQSSVDPTKESLKIIKEARGARKLREHELSYFGVQISRNDENDIKTNLLPSTMLSNNTPKRSLPQRKLIEDQPMLTTATRTTINKTPLLNESRNETKNQATSKWQLLNDKPDLLRHSPIAVEPQVITRIAEINPKHNKTSSLSTRRELREKQKEELSDDDEEHLYENISNEITPVFKVKTAHAYDRKQDLERDARILSEMTKTADQTLKAISDEAAIKDQRRRSLQRRNSKPLETIDEKSIAEKINDTCIAVKVARGTYASEAKRTARHSTPSPTGAPAHSRTRTSSQSSADSCPRARSRSLSSERDYENIKAKPSSSKVKHTKSSSGQRSSSRESQRSGAYSSGEDTGRAEREQRGRIKQVKRSTASSAVQTSREHKQGVRDKHERYEREQHKSTASKSGDKQRSTTHSSPREERAECTQARQRSSSGRRHRDEHESEHSKRSSSDKRDKHEHSSQSSGTGVRLLRALRGHEHETSSLRASKHRTERADKEREREKEKEKLSRSKGHSSRSITAHTSERHAATQPRVSSPTKLREHKKSSTTTSSSEPKSHDHTTHSKNTQIVNGHGVHEGKHTQQSRHATRETLSGKVRKSKK